MFHARMRGCGLLPLICRFSARAALIRELRMVGRNPASRAR
jgi:hypothetical protein